MVLRPPAVKLIINAANFKRRYPMAELKEYTMEHIFSYEATTDPTPDFIGPVAQGIRLNAYFNGGTVSGPKVNGKILPVGGDFITVRTDGVGDINVRLSIQTDDGALIYQTNTGVLELGENGYEDFMNMKLQEVTQVRANIRFQTSHENYLWLNRKQCIGIGQFFAMEGKVKYDVYALG